MIAEIILGLIVALSAIVLLFFVTVMVWPSPRTFWYCSKLQGPMGIPFLGNSLDMARLDSHEILSYFMGHFQCYSRYFRLWFIGIPLVCLYEPEDVEAVMGSIQHIDKGREYVPVTLWLNEGLLTSTGTKWHKMRKLLSSSFHFQILNDNLDSMNRSAKLLTKKLLDSKERFFSLEPYIKLFTLDIICETVMGVRLGAQENKGLEYVTAIRRICEIIMDRERLFWQYKNWMFSLLPAGFTFRKIRKYLHDFSDKVILDRKQQKSSEVQENGDMDFEGKTRQAFLDTLLECRETNPDSMSKDDIREQVDTFMFEGHDTVSSAILFTLLLIGHHSHVQEKIVREMYELFGDSDRDVEMKDISQMVYLEKVIKESMRLYPPVPYMSRLLNADLELDKLFIPKGANLIILPYLIHRNPKYFPDPEKFDPDRFTERSPQKSHPFAYIPFSAGPRNCIGQKFAMMELKVAISTILRRAHLTSITKLEDIELLMLLILRPHIPVHIKFTPRESLKLSLRFY